DYDTWTATYTSDKGEKSPSGGAGLDGGFYLDPGWKVRPGYTLTWVQLVASPTKTTLWNAPAGKPFPDTADRNPPEYPTNGQVIKVQPPDLPGMPSYPFLDYPTRSFNESEQTWTATLGLAAIEDKPNEKGFTRVIVEDTFNWGFTLAAKDNMV